MSEANKTSVLTRKFASLGPSINIRHKENKSNSLFRYLNKRGSQW
jgi:hypothetical protein